MHNRTSPLTSPSTAPDDAEWQRHLDEQSALFAALERKLADAHAELTALRAREQERRLQDAAVLAMAEDTRLPLSARLVGIYIRTKERLWPLVQQVGAEPHYAQPVRVRMLDVADALGIHSRIAGYSTNLVASAGYLTRECRIVWEEDQPRTHVYLASGPGRADTAVVTPRQDYQREQKEAERAERAAREAGYKRDIEELKQAAVYAREMGCPVCGGALAPTGYYCAHCNAEQPTALLARLPVLDERTAEESP